MKDFVRFALSLVALTLLIAFGAEQQPKVTQGPEKSFLEFSATPLAPLAFTSTSAVPHANLGPDGIFRRTGSAKIVELSEHRLVLECEYRPPVTVVCAVYHADGICPDALVDHTQRWREVYLIVGGKLNLAEVIVPKVTPPQPQRIEWPK